MEWSDFSAASARGERVVAAEAVGADDVKTKRQAASKPQRREERRGETPEPKDPEEKPRYTRYTRKKGRKMEAER
jgi:hypothetical protein